MCAPPTSSLRSVPMQVIKLDPPHRSRKGGRRDETGARNSPAKDRLQKVEKRMSMWFGLSDPYAGQSAFMEIRDPNDAKKEAEAKQEQKRKEEDRKAELLKLRQVYGEENGMAEYYKFIQKEKKLKKAMGGNSLATMGAKRKSSVGTRATDSLCYRRPVHSVPTPLWPHNTIPSCMYIDPLTTSYVRLPKSDQLGSNFMVSFILCFWFMILHRHAQNAYNTSVGIDIPVIDI